MLSPTEFGDKKVPDSIISCVLTLHKEIFQKVKLHDPVLRAYALHYFKVTYKENQNDDYFLIFRAIAALHLASKVCEDGKMLELFVKALDECRGKDNLIEAFALLGEVHRINKDFVKIVTESCRLAELDLIQDLQFNFKVVLPYDYMREYIHHVVHWHMPSYYPNYHNITHVTIQNCYKFLNDLQLSPIFYNFTSPTVALAAVSLSFYMEKLDVPDFNGKPWASIVEPTVDIEQLNTCIDQIKLYFKSKNCDIENLFHAVDRHDALSDWYISPIEDHRSKEPSVPPPDDYMMQAFNCTEDAFSKIWSDHKPDIPPPTVDEYQEAIDIAIEEESNGNLLISGPKIPDGQLQPPRRQYNPSKPRISTRPRFENVKNYPSQRRPNYQPGGRRDDFHDRRSPSIDRRLSEPERYERRSVDPRNDFYPERRPDYDRRMSDYPLDKRHDDYLLDRRPPESFDRRSEPPYDRRSPAYGHSRDDDRKRDHFDYEKRLDPRDFDRRSDSRPFDYERRPEPRDLDRRSDPRDFDRRSEPRPLDHERRPDPRDYDRRDFERRPDDRRSEPRDIDRRNDDRRIEERRSDPRDFERKSDDRRQDPRDPRDIDRRSDDRRPDDRRQDPRDIDRRSDDRRSDPRDFERKSDDRRVDDRRQDPRDIDRRNDDRRVEERRPDTRDFDRRLDERRSEPRDIDRRIDERRPDTRDIDRRSDDRRQDPRDIDRRIDERRSEPRDYERRPEPREFDRRLDERRPDPRDFDRRSDERRPDPRDIDRRIDPRDYERRPDPRDIDRRNDDRRIEPKPRDYDRKPPDYDRIDRRPPEPPIRRSDSREIRSDYERRPEPRPADYGRRQEPREMDRKPIARSESFDRRKQDSRRDNYNR